MKSEKLDPPSLAEMKALPKKLTGALDKWHNSYWDAPLPRPVNFRPIVGPQIDLASQTASYEDFYDFIVMLHGVFNDNLIEATVQGAMTDEFTRASAAMDATGDVNALIEFNIVISAPDAAGAQFRKPLGTGVRLVGTGRSPFETALLEAAYPRDAMDAVPDGYTRDHSSSTYLWLKRDPATGDTKVWEVPAVARKQMRNEITVLRRDGELIRQLGTAQTLRTVAEIASAAIVRAGTQNERNAMAALHQEIAANRERLNAINQQLADELARQAAIASAARTWAVVGAIANFAGALGGLLTELGAFAPEGLAQAATKEDVQRLLDGAEARLDTKIDASNATMKGEIDALNSNIEQLRNTLPTFEFNLDLRQIIKIEPGPNGTVLPLPLP